MSTRAFAIVQLLAFAACQRGSPAVDEAPLPPRTCRPATTPGRLARLATEAVEVVRGACDVVSWVDVSGAVLLSRAGQPPVQLALEGSKLVLSPSGHALTFRERGATGDVQRLVDLDVEPGAGTAAGLALPSCDGAGFCLAAPHFITTTRGEEQLVVETDGAFEVLRADGTVRRLDRLNQTEGVARQWSNWSRQGARVVVLEGGFAVTLSLETGERVAWVEADGAPVAVDPTAPDWVLLSSRAGYALHQPRALVPCGDTACDTPLPSRVIDLSTGRVVEHAASLAFRGVEPLRGQAFAPDDVDALVVMGQGATFVHASSSGVSRSEGKLLAVLPGGRVLTGGAGFPNRELRVLGGGEGETLVGEGLPIWSTDGIGSTLLANRFSAQCVWYPDGHACHTQLWELVQSGTATPRAFASQPMQLKWVSSTGDALVDGVLFDGPPPHDSPAGQLDVPWASWWLSADGRRVPLPWTPLGVFSTPTHRLLFSQTKVTSFDPAALTETLVLSDPRGVALLGDVGSDALVVTQGQEVKLVWFGAPAR